jgi:hypothetical protein
MEFGVVTLFYQKWSLFFYSKIIKAGEILLVVKFHRLFHLRGGFCPSLAFGVII